MVRLNNSVGKSKIKNSKSSKNQIKSVKSVNKETKQIDMDGVIDISNSSSINKIEIVENKDVAKEKENTELSKDTNSNNILNNIKIIQLNNKLINLNFNRNKKRRIGLDDLRDRKEFQNNFEKDNRNKKEEKKELSGITKIREIQKINLNTMVITNVNVNSDMSMSFENLNIFDTLPSTIPSLSRPAIALKTRKSKNKSNKNNGGAWYSNNVDRNSINDDDEDDDDQFLKVNSIAIRPRSVTMNEALKKERKKSSDMNQMLTRRQSNIVYRVQCIQNEIIRNLNTKRQLYYFGNKNVDMNSNLSLFDKNNITKENKRKIRKIDESNEKLIKIRYEIYLKYQQKSDFSDFGIYKNFFFLVGDISDSFWKEVGKIIKSGNEKPDYVVTRLARAAVEGEIADVTIRVNGKTLCLFLYYEIS